MGKHRDADRQKVLKPASIEFDGEAVQCMVRNISTAGALIDASRSTAIPAEFVLSLLFDGPHGSRKRCRVVWRRDNRLGVEFE